MSTESVSFVNCIEVYSMQYACILVADRNSGSGPVPAVFSDPVPVRFQVKFRTGTGIFGANFRGLFLPKLTLVITLSLCHKLIFRILRNLTLYQYLHISMI